MQRRPFSACGKTPDDNMGTMVNCNKKACGQGEHDGETQAAGELPRRAPVENKSGRKHDDRG